MSTAPTAPTTTRPDSPATPLWSGVTADPVLGGVVFLVGGAQRVSPFGHVIDFGTTAEPCCSRCAATPGEPATRGPVAPGSGSPTGRPRTAAGRRPSPTLR